MGTSVTCKADVDIFNVQKKDEDKLVSRPKAKSRKKLSRCSEGHVMVFKKFLGTWEHFCLGCDQYFPENKEVVGHPNSKSS